MRYVLILVGAAVVTYFLVMGIRAFIAERNEKPAPNNTDSPSGGEKQ